MSKNSDDEVRGLKHIVEFATIVGVIATALTGYIAYRQYTLSSETAEAQKQQRSEDDRRNDREEERTTLITRPWVRATAIVGTDIPQSGAILTVAFRNSGHTPAVIQPFTHVQLFHNPLTPDEALKMLRFDFDLSITEPTGLGLLVAASDSENQESKRIPRHEIKPADIADTHGINRFKSSKAVRHALLTKTLYLWGALIYADGLHQQHETKYCFELRPEDTELHACPFPFLNVLDEPVRPTDAACISPQTAGEPHTHPAPCKQTVQ